MHKQAFADILQNRHSYICNFIKKEVLVQVFSCKFCEAFNNTFFTEHRQVTTSGNVALAYTSIDDIDPNLLGYIQYEVSKENMPYLSEN